MNHIDVPIDLLLPALSGIIIALISAGGTLLALRPTINKLRAERDKIEAESKKTDADAADVLTGAALNLVKQLQVRIKGLEEDVSELQQSVERQRSRIRVVTKLNARLLQGASLLVAQIVESGQEPVWRIECDVAGDEELAAELLRLGNSHP